MIELIKYVVGSFAEKPDLIDYDIKEEGKSINVTVTLDPEDMGKVIGKQGRIAKSIRSVVKAAASKEDKKVIVDILQ